MAGSVAACGGFLGFGDDGEDEPIPDPAAADGGAETATGGNEVDGGGAVDGGTDPGDADLGDVVVVVPPIDAAVDAPPADQLFPRLATFESGTLTGQNGADVNDGMKLLSGGGLKGTYAATTSDPSTAVGFTFASKPPEELYAAFLFRIDAVSPTQTPAAFFRLALPGNGNILAAVQNDGDVYVSAGTPKKIATVTVGTVYRFGIHTRVSPPALEVVVVPEGMFKCAVPNALVWSSPAAILGSSIGELSGTSMRITVDQIAFNQTGFDPNQ